MADSISTVADLKERMDGPPFAMVTTVDERGTLSSRPVTMQQIGDDGDVWFLVDAKAEWVAPINGDPINVAVAEDDTWISFAGRATIVRDQAMIDALTDPMSETYFDEDSEIVALHVVTDRVEWWASRSKPAQLVALAKAKVTGDEPDVGESGTIET